MLLAMKSKIHAGRAICYFTAASLDRARSETNGDVKSQAAETASLLIPLAKAYGSDVGCEVASLGIQIHGGMGFIEETGAAQHMRDARIAPIYEGTNGIQAIDLVMRKLPASGGAAVRSLMEEMSAIAEELATSGHPDLVATGIGLREANGSFKSATDFVLDVVARSAQQDALAGATPYLALFGHTLGLALLSRTALAAHRQILSGTDSPANKGRIVLARFFADQVACQVPGLAQAVLRPSTITEHAEAALYY